MRETKVLVIGATALACGLALRLGADCTVADSGWSAGAEFADAMVAEPIDPGKNRPPRTAELVEELWERNILSRTGEVHCPALAGAFAKRFCEAGSRVLLGAFSELRDGRTGLRSRSSCRARDARSFLRSG